MAGLLYGAVLVYILGSWLPTLVKAVGMTVSRGHHDGDYRAAAPRLVVCRLADGQDQPPSRAGDNLRRWRPVHHGDGLRRGSFALLCMLAFISGACLNGANTGMNALSARYYPTQARATGSQLDARRRAHRRHSQRLCRRRDDQPAPLKASFDPRYPGSPHRRRLGGEGHLCGRSSSHRFNFPPRRARSVIAASGPRCNRRIAPPSAANKENLFHILLKRKRPQQSGRLRQAISRLTFQPSAKKLSLIRSPSHIWKINSTTQLKQNKHFLKLKSVYPDARCRRRRRERPECK